MLITNIGQLKAFVKDLPDEAPINAIGPDSGGYDIQPCDILEAHFDWIYYLKPNAFSIGENDCGVERKVKGLLLSGQEKGSSRLL